MEPSIRELWSFVSQFAGSVCWQINKRAVALHVTCMSEDIGQGQKWNWLSCNHFVGQYIGSAIWLLTRPNPARDGGPIFLSYILLVPLLHVLCDAMQSLVVAKGWSLIRELSKQRTILLYTSPLEPSSVHSLRQVIGLRPLLRYDPLLKSESTWLHRFPNVTSRPPAFVISLWFIIELMTFSCRDHRHGSPLPDV